MKKRGHISDRRVTRQEGDGVKLKKGARDAILKGSGITIPTWAIGTVTKVWWDIEWYADVSIYGQVYVCSLRDLIAA